MKTQRLRMRRQILIVVALAGCTKDPAPPPVAAKNPFEVSLTAKGPWSVGTESWAALTVKATSGFHVNPEYPVTFKPEGSEAVKFSSERVQLTAGTKTPCAEKAEDACTVEFPLPVTPEKAGPGKLAGVLAFSVCSAEKCLIEKVPLSLAISAQ